MSEKYDEIPMAGNIVEPGNATKYKTGGWRDKRPIHTPEPHTDVVGIDDDGKEIKKTQQCIWIKSGACGRCWIYCPDNAVILKEEDGKRTLEYDLDFCKGCGICANECPTDSIRMESE